MDKSKYGVHRTHCCKKHGCKYGDEDCPVVTGKIKQDYPCEDCYYDMDENMQIVKENVWVIMDKTHKIIAKGTPRNRELCHIDEGDKKRFLTYSSEQNAQAGYESNGFYASRKANEYFTSIHKNYIGCGSIDFRRENLEPVECIMSIEIKE